MPHSTLNSSGAVESQQLQQHRVQCPEGSSAEADGKFPCSITGNALDKCQFVVNAPFFLTSRPLFLPSF